LKYKLLKGAVRSASFLFILILFYHGVSQSFNGVALFLLRVTQGNSVELRG
jgi:hypothetical protein